MKDARHTCVASATDHVTRSPFAIQICMGDGDRLGQGSLVRVSEWRILVGWSVRCWPETGGRRAATEAKMALGGVLAPARTRAGQGGKLSGKGGMGSGSGGNGGDVG
jgi:hypothetical protein